jgi:hypothetical protein
MRLACSFLVTLLACGDSDPSLTADAAGSADGGIDAAELPGRTVTFPPSDETFLSPERGFYTTTNLATVRDLDYVRAEGKTLVYAAVHLDAYLGTDHEQDLPAELFADVQAGFDAVRAAGLKAIVRFQYDDGEGYPDGANDASEASMTRHIEQLAPLLADNVDVIFVLQAGFIGAWGEWHTSNNFVDGPDGAEPRARIVDALLAALPASQRIALRYPAYKRMFYGNVPSRPGAAADDARVGHLNDCFLASDDDLGTYQYEPQETLEAYLELDTLAVPIGGETCAVHPRNACDIATAELARFHWSYLNDDYHPDVLARWDEEGCRPAIEQRLGYRLRLVSLTLPEVAPRGTAFVVRLVLANDGYAAPTNQRPVRLIFAGGDERHVVDVDVDVTSLLPGSSELTAAVTLPADFPLGEAQVSLWLPDTASALEARPEYALRLANPDIWDAASGEHRLTTLSVE